METDLLSEELQKIDVVRERTGLSFEEARNLLADAKWDVMEALVTYDQESNSRQWEVKGYEVVDKVKQLINKGNVTKIRIRSKDRLIMEFPVTVGVIGSVFAPKLILLAGITCLLTKCTIEFDQAESQDEQDN